MNKIPKEQQHEWSHRTSGNFRPTWCIHCKQYKNSRNKDKECPARAPKQ